MKAKLFLSAAFAAALGMYAAIAAAQEKRESTGREVFFSNESVINHHEDGHKYRIRLEKSKIVELIVDGKEVPESEYPKYEPMVRKILEQAEKDRARAEVDRAEAEKHREEAAQHRIQAEKDREQAEVHRKQAERDREEANKHREQAEKDRAEAQIARQQAEKDRQQAEVHRAQAEKDRTRAEIDRKKAEEDRKLFEAMLDEIVNEKLVESRDALKSLTLDGEELIINGVKQSDAMHTKFRTKYLKAGQNRIRYSTSGNFRGISMD